MIAVQIYESIYIEIDMGVTYILELMSNSNSKIAYLK